MATQDLHNHILRVSGRRGAHQHGCAPLGTVVIANVLLLVSLGSLFTAPLVGAPLTALLVCVSKKNRRLGFLWVRY